MTDLELQQLELAGQVAQTTYQDKHVAHAAGLAVTRLAAEVRQLRKVKDGAYAERNQVVALLSRMALALGYRAGVRSHPAEDATWEADWRTLVMVDLPTGQVSWHFHDSERALVSGLPAYLGEWDGHTTAQKYDRVNGCRPGNEQARTLERQRDTAVWMAQNLSAFETGAEWMREKAARAAESYEPHCESCPRGVAGAIRHLSTKGDEGS